MISEIHRIDNIEKESIDILSLNNERNNFRELC